MSRAAFSEYVFGLFLSDDETFAVEVEGSSDNRLDGARFFGLLLKQLDSERFPDYIVKMIFLKYWLKK